MRKNLLQMRTFVMVLFPVALAAGLARADVRLPAVIDSQMVLQRDLPLPIWGWADPGEAVSVRLDDNAAVVDDNTSTNDNNTRRAVRVIRVIVSIDSCARVN